jgi:hypothetical protein
VPPGTRSGVPATHLPRGEQGRRAPEDVDGRKPLVGGITATRELRTALSQPPGVRAVRTCGDEETVDTAQHAGADGSCLSAPALTKAWPPSGWSPGTAACGTSSWRDRSSRTQPAW